MTTALALNESLNEQIEVYKNTFCKGATNDEVRLFLMVQQRTGLSPEARQIFMVPRWDSALKRMIMTPQTSVDGFRVIAERSKHYAGQLGPFFTDDGKWTDVWLKSGYPRAAKVGVLRHDFKEPLWAVALWDSYVQTTKEGRVTSMWHKMPDIMLAKCAESLALRKAFPQDLSGLYTVDEYPASIEAIDVESSDKLKGIENKPIAPIAKPEIFFQNSDIKIEILHEKLAAGKVPQEIWLEGYDAMHGKEINKANISAAYKDLWEVYEENKKNPAKIVTTQDVKLEDDEIPF